MSATLTNILVDGISSRIITRVSESLTDDLGLYLQSSISEVLLPNLVSSLMKSLSLSVPETLNRVLPDLLSRSILPTMTDTLTRSLTHSLTHTISISWETAEVETMMSSVVFVTTAEHIARSVTIQQALCITQATMPTYYLISPATI